MKKNDFKVLRQNVGIDLSKDDFKADITVLTENLECRTITQKKFNNSPSGITEFLKWSDSNKANSSMELGYTMEATGIYHENLAYALFEKEKAVHVVLPNLAKKFAESIGYKSKTDKLDAKSLGRMGVERILTRWKPCSKNIKVLKNLTRERAMRQKEKTKAKNQLHALRYSNSPNQSTLERYDSLISFLEDQVKVIEKEINELIQSDQVLSKKVEKITSTPGLGLITVASVIAETNGFASITNIKQLQSYAGYDIRIRESGKWKGRSKISKKGNSYIRHALYFPSYTIIKYSKYHKSFYDRLVEKKGKSLIASTAIQRKLLGLIYTLWKNDTYFDPNYSQKKQDIHRELHEPVSSFGLL